LIKKQRQDFLVEKCTELGVKNLQPILTDHCEVRKVNQEKIKLQTIEASEQCERLTIPNIQDLQKLDAFLNNAQGLVYYCIERETAPFIHKALGDLSDTDIFLIGPEGGFSEKEKHLLEENPNTVGVTLGPTILRAETAAIMCVTAWVYKLNA
jgi:16S rRNA (uracil1498-N3)-methyltransferase